MNKNTGLWVALAVAGVFSALLLKTYWEYLFFAVLFAVLFTGFNERLAKNIGKNASAIIVTAGIIILLVAPTIYIVAETVYQAPAAYQTAIGALDKESVRSLLGVSGDEVRAVAIALGEKLRANVLENAGAYINRASEMLQRASDLDLTYDGGSSLNARITNQGGHKLPSGYPEGRAMWINVKFVNANGDVIREYGAYDAVTSRFSRDTKVYEAELGLDAYAAQVTGKPAGPGFHFALNNTYYLDNRIPPRGFTNAGFASVGAAPVNYTYADGQYWDDTAFPVPPAAVRADVRVYHQVTTTDYIEFLRDANTTNADGQIAYDQWVANGKSTPTVMDEVSIDFPSNCSVDFNGDGLFPDTADIDDLLNAYTSQAPSCDINADAVVSPADLQLFLLRFSGGACN